MQFVRIRKRKDLERYARDTQTQIGVLFPIEYLLRSRVFAILDEDGQMHGGFAIVLDPPFRVIESLPNETRKDHPFFVRVKPNKVCELTALWMSRKAREKTFLSFQFWSRAYFEMLGSGKSHFVYAYAAHKAHLTKIFGTAWPEVLFRGETKLMPGMTGAEFESVEAINILKMAVVPLIKPHFFLRKIRLSSGRLSHAQSSQEV